jgi:hypothetical protein
MFPPSHALSKVSLVPSRSLPFKRALCSCIAPLPAAEAISVERYNLDALREESTRRSVVFYCCALHSYKVCFLPSGLYVKSPLLARTVPYTCLSFHGSWVKTLVTGCNGGAHLQHCPRSQCCSVKSPYMPFGVGYNRLWGWLRTLQRLRSPQSAVPSAASCDISPRPSWVPKLTIDKETRLDADTIVHYYDT